jgi:hypothetical protein
MATGGGDLNNNDNNIVGDSHMEAVGTIITLRFKNSLYNRFCNVVGSLAFG